MIFQRGPGRTRCSSSRRRLVGWQSGRGFGRNEGVRPDLQFSIGLFPARVLARWNDRARVRRVFLWVASEMNRLTIQETLWCQARGLEALAPVRFRRGLVEARVVPAAQRLM